MPITDHESAPARSTIITNLEKLLGGPRDGALLRYSLGNEFLKIGSPENAADYLRSCLAYDRHYSAAWKLLGKALTDCGDRSAALSAFEEGIRVAEESGDVQAAKEMQVFAKRLRRETPAG